MDGEDVATAVVVGALGLFGAWVVACTICLAEGCFWTAIGGDPDYSECRGHPWGWRVLASAGIGTGCVAWMHHSGPEPSSFVDYASAVVAIGAGVWGAISGVVWLALLPVRMTDAAAAAMRRVAAWREHRRRARQAREAVAASERERTRREEEDRRRHEEYMAAAPVRAAEAAERAARAEAERLRQERLRLEVETAARTQAEVETRRRREAAAREAERAKEEKRKWEAAPKDRRCTHCGLRYPPDVTPSCVRCGLADGQEEVLAGG